VPLLLNRWTEQDESAEVVSPIAAEDIACYSTDWLPPITAKVNELKNAGQYTREGVLRHNVEDVHWEWPQKVAARSGELQWNSFALRCGGKTQGMMFVNLLRRCRLAGQVNEHLVYVDLVATAPWNRPRLVERPLYRGVGFVLLVEAIALSEAEGFCGRIGLHTLPGSDAFYRTQFGMQALGPDPGYQGLHYLELTSEHAVSFLA
jgi:hypothetical protein